MTQVNLIILSKHTTARIGYANAGRPLLSDLYPCPQSLLHFLCIFEIIERLASASLQVPLTRPTKSVAIQTLPFPLQCLTQRILAPNESRFNGIQMIGSTSGHSRSPVVREPSWNHTSRHAAGKKSDEESCDAHVEV